MGIHKVKRKPCRNTDGGAILTSEGGAFLPKVNDMKKFNAVLVGALMGAMLATPVLAASSNACLQHNRIWGWRALDERTVLVTDRMQNRYTINMSGSCFGLTDGGAILVFRTWTNLSCVGVGDLLGVRTPGLGFISCSISNVQAGAPGATPG